MCHQQYHMQFHHVVVRRQDLKPHSEIQSGQLSIIIIVHENTLSEISKLSVFDMFTIISWFDHLHVYVDVKVNGQKGNHDNLFIRNNARALFIAWCHVHLDSFILFMVDMWYNPYAQQTSQVWVNANWLSLCTISALWNLQLVLA